MSIDAADTPPHLRTDCLSDRDVMLLGYQRTAQISRAARRAWEAGDPAPLAAETAARREDILAGAIAEVHADYRPLGRHLAETGARPGHVVDIGCGAGILDAFLARDGAGRITLVDIETTPRQYHQFASEGAGYASLAAARALVEANAPGVAVATVNPAREPGALDALTADLAVSFISCGFHYPVDAYLPLFLRVLEAGGRVCLDLRRRYLARRPPALDRLLGAGRVTVLAETPKAQKTLIAPR